MTDLLTKIIDKLWAYSGAMQDRIALIEDKKGMELPNAKIALDDARRSIQKANTDVDNALPKVLKVLDDKSNKDDFESVRAILNQVRDDVEVSHSKLLGVIVLVKDELGIEDHPVTEKAATTTEDN